MTARVSMLLKSRASLICFRARFLPGRAKDLSAHPVGLLCVGKNADMDISKHSALENILTVEKLNTMGMETIT